MNNIHIHILFIYSYIIKYIYIWSLSQPWMNRVYTQPTNLDRTIKKRMVRSDPHNFFPYCPSFPFINSFVILLFILIKFVILVLKKYYSVTNINIIL